MRSRALLVFGELSQEQGAPPALPAARKELEAIASLLPHATMLPGSEFSSSSASGMPIVHFALHAAGHRDAPYLALSGDRALGVSAIEELPLTQTSLVVLSACATDAGPTRNTGTPVSLSQAALRAGARVVVASLWPIDDESAARFSEAYYRALITKSDPITALQSTQVALITAARPPREWAVFVATAGTFPIAGRSGRY
jgi:CHAT domain-containing protein